jgi:hypothetical protein
VEELQSLQSLNPLKLNLFCGKDIEAMHINFKDYKQNSSFQKFFKETSYVKSIFFIEPKWLHTDSGKMDR